MSVKGSRSLFFNSYLTQICCKVDMMPTVYLAHVVIVPTCAWCDLLYFPLLLFVQLCT